MARQKILMCAPDHFGVDYVINPWMENHIGQTDRVRAHRQWEGLRDALSARADIALLPPEPGLPDMVFTANAGLVWKDAAVVSRFVSKERRGEEHFFRAFFEKAGFRVAVWPDEVTFEGAGDALFDRGQEILWQGYGFRSDRRATGFLQEALGVRVIGLHLVDPRFYHLDTCFCPLPGGWLLYFPGAFAPESRAAIEAAVPPEKRLAAEEADAVTFCCNAVELEGEIFMNGASVGLQARLRAAGFTPHLISLSEYLLSGGAAKCLTLKLQEPEGR